MPFVASQISACIATDQRVYRRRYENTSTLRALSQATPRTLAVSVIPRHTFRSLVNCFTTMSLSVQELQLRFLAVYCAHQTTLRGCKRPLRAGSYFHPCRQEQCPPSRSVDLTIPYRTRIVHCCVSIRTRVFNTPLHTQSGGDRHRGALATIVFHSFFAIILISEPFTHSHASRCRWLTHSSAQRMWCSSNSASYCRTGYARARPVHRIASLSQSM